jgi:hypothetical protein
MLRDIHTVRHVDDIVYDLGYLLNGEAFEIPERGRSSDANCFARRKAFANENKKFEIGGSVVGTARWDTWNVRRTCKVVSLSISRAKTS